MNDNEVMDILQSLKWPSYKHRYIVRREPAYPPYNVLTKMLRIKGITPELTWDKQKCIDVLGGIEEIEKYNKSSDTAKAPLVVN